MNLQELHDKLISEGCNRFCIEGVGEQLSDDVDRLGIVNGEWAVFYMERGKASDPFYKTSSQEDAIAYYYRYIKSIEHLHLLAFTRSAEINEEMKAKLETAGIRTIQNDIPNYAGLGDRVYRIFVVNGDIFKAKILFEKIPYMDAELKR